jgi:hypothetical protein
MTLREARGAAQDDSGPATGEPHSMVREVGQSFYLMALMALMLTVYVGLGLLAVRLFG